MTSSTSTTTNQFPMRIPTDPIRKRPRRVSSIVVPSSPHKRSRTVTSPPPPPHHFVELIPPSVSISSLPPREYNAPYSNLSSKEASQVWYSRAELSALRLQARLFLFGVDPPTDGGDNDDEPTTRGYERFTDMPAHHRKLMARKAVLLAHHKYQLPPHKLAVIARRVAERSIQDAFMLGCQDYCDVHCHLQPDEEEETKRAVPASSTTTPQLRSILRLSSLSPPPDVSSSTTAVTIRLPPTALPSLSSRRVSVDRSHCI